MFLSSEEISKRLNSTENLSNILKDDKNVEVKKWPGSNGGRTEGSTNLTEDEKVAVALLATSEGDSIAAEVVGVAKTTAGTYRRSEIAADIIEKTKDKIEDKAAERLLAALGFLTDDKMQNAKGTEIASIAVSLSRLGTNIRPINKDVGSKVNVQVVLHQPKPMKEEHYEVIEVSA